MDDASLMESTVIDSFSELSSTEFENWEREWTNSTENFDISPERMDNHDKSSVSTKKIDISSGLGGMDSSSIPTTEVAPVNKSQETEENIGTISRIQKTFGNVFSYIFS